MLAILFLLKLIKFFSRFSNASLVYFSKSFILLSFSNKSLSILSNFITYVSSNVNTLVSFSLHAYCINAMLLLMSLTLKFVVKFASSNFYSSFFEVSITSKAIVSFILPICFCKFHIRSFCFI